MKFRLSVFVLVPVLLAMFLVVPTLSGSKEASTGLVESMYSKESTNIKELKAKFRTSPDFKTSSRVETNLSSTYYPGYIYLQSHINGSTYSVTQGDTLHVSYYATDYSGWNSYSTLIGVWDTYTNDFVHLYGEFDDPIYYSENGYADIDTSSLVASSGRYEVHVILWDDIYDDIEDIEGFNLNVEAPVAYYAYLYSDNALYATIPYTYGAGCTLPIPTRSGYTFKGWYDASGNRVYLVSNTDTGNKTYYAQWHSNSNYLTKMNKSTGKWRKTWSKSRTSNVLTISRSKSSAKLKATISANAKVYVKYSGGSYSNITGKYKTVKVSKGKSKTLYFKVISQSGNSRTYKVVVKRSR